MIAIGGQRYLAIFHKDISRSLFKIFQICVDKAIIPLRDLYYFGLYIIKVINDKTQRTFSYYCIVRVDISSERFYFQFI